MKPETVTWFLHKVQQVADITLVYTFRHFGLSHPNTSFLVSSNVVVLGDAGDIAFWIDVVSPSLGINLAKHCAGIVSWMMPPALSNVDTQLNLQEAHIAEAECHGSFDAETVRVDAGSRLGRSDRDPSNC